MKSKVAVLETYLSHLLYLSIPFVMLLLTLITKKKYACLALTAVFLALHAMPALNADLSTTTILSVSSAKKSVETARGLLWLATMATTSTETVAARTVGYKLATTALEGLLTLKTLAAHLSRQL